MSSELTLRRSSFYNLRACCRSSAGLERLTVDQEVKGSNPFGSTNSDAPQRLFSFHNVLDLEYPRPRG